MAIWNVGDQSGQRLRFLGEDVNIAAMTQRRLLHMVLLTGHNTYNLSQIGDGETVMTKESREQRAGHGETGRYG